MEEAAAAGPPDPPAPSWARSPDYDALNTYSWAWSPADSTDENYTDLAYLVARNSTCKDGHMGCVLVRGVKPGSGGERVGAARGDVLLCAINSSLFGALRSDCHAEANAVAECAARGLSLRTAGTDAADRAVSCYVTREPCLACYKLLASAGVSRIVAPRAMDSADAVASAAVLGIEYRAVPDSDARAARRLVLGRQGEDVAVVRARREERKRLKQERQLGRKAIRQAAAASRGS